MAIALDSRTRPAVARRRRSPWAFARDHVVWVAATLALIYLLLPNMIVVLFSFNKPNGRFNYTWQRFSLDAWKHPCGAPGMCHSLGLSLKIGVLATIGATVLGTLVAFALGRYRFRGRSVVNLLGAMSRRPGLHAEAFRWASGRSWLRTSCSA